MNGDDTQNHPDSIAYTISSLPFGIELPVKKSSNAWWMDRVKVEKLFAAFSIQADVLEACSHANITHRQYKYFVETHPEVKEIRKGFYVNSNLYAKKNINKRVQEGDFRASTYLLKNKSPQQKEYEEVDVSHRLDQIQLTFEEQQELMASEFGSIINAYEEVMRKVLTTKPGTKENNIGLFFLQKFFKETTMDHPILQNARERFLAKNNKSV